MAMALHDLSFEFTDISQCQRTWNFGPRKALPAQLPAWALGGFLISGFELESPHPVQNVTNASPEQGAELFFSLYHQLSWPEFVRLSHRPELSQKIDCEFLLNKYGAKADARYKKTSDFLLNWPAEIQDYLSDKEVRPSDMAIVDQLDLPAQKDILALLVHLKPSKSLFCQLLELSGEMILMETPIENVMEALKSLKPLEALRQLRFPVSSQKDLGFKNSIAGLQWPKGVTAQSLRKGDVQGVEVKFFVKDAAELEKTLSGLQAVASSWKQENEADPAL